MGRVVIGTAGHIDHGKSTLVRALTGTDPDRLPEEKRRGITVDLGYAFLGEDAAIIDVPGHERLIRNMVAGAATIDYALLVVAADDGLMPQTTEHLHILRLLGVKDGSVVITKADLVDDDWIMMVSDQVMSAVRNTFLEGKPLHIVDALSGRGIAELSNHLRQTVAATTSRSSSGVFRLPIDRVFSIKGHGTVVTGTILSGSVRKDARLMVLPGGDEVRVKHLETQGSSADQLVAGQRAALNLVGANAAVERGKTLATPRGLCVTSRILVQSETLPGMEPFDNDIRIRFLVGTQEVIGRLRVLALLPPRNSYAHIRLESEIVAAWHDHFILRRYSPMETIGGGIVLDPRALPVRIRDLPEELRLCEALSHSDLPKALRGYVEIRGRDGIAISGLSQVFAMTESQVRIVLSTPELNSEICEVAGLLLMRSRLEQIKASIAERIALLHRNLPESHGFSPTELRSETTATLGETLFDSVLDTMVDARILVREGGLFRHVDAKVSVSSDKQDLIREVVLILKRSGFSPPSANQISEQIGRPRAEIEKLLVFMEREHLCRRLGIDLFFDTEVFERSIAAVQRALSTSNGLSVADVTRLLDSSRKFVLPFLEYLDSQGITERRDSIRVVGRRGLS